MVRSSTWAVVCSVSIAVVGLSAAGCSFDSEASGCQSNADCRGSRVCVDGVCLISDGGTGSDAEDGETGTGTSTAGTDGTSSTDGTSTTEGGESDGGGDTVADTGGDGWMPVDSGPDTGGSDAGDADGGLGRPLSCHEFATCQGVACERYDYSCKQEFSERTSAKQLRQLDARQRCVRNNCAGTTGHRRLQCVENNCESEWEACANRPAGGPSLDCAEFHSCTYLCGGAKNRQTCLADCRSRATQQARRGLQQYNQCVSRNCQGTTGRRRLECARNNCRAELQRCWGC